MSHGTLDFPLINSGVTQTMSTNGGLKPPPRVDLLLRPFVAHVLPELLSKSCEGIPLFEQGSFTGKTRLLYFPNVSNVKEFLCLTNAKLLKKVQWFY